MDQPLANGDRIYLDNAATSWPKPPGVLHAMQQFLLQQGGSAGRGGSRAAMAAAAVGENARQRVALLIGATDARTVAFAHNGTDALNLAIHGVLRQGDHIVTTVCEHNSVLRPLHHAAGRLPCEVTYVDCDDQGVVAAEAIVHAVRPATRLVVLTHASNVTGALQPVARVRQLLSGHSALVLADASQTAGHVPIDVAALEVDLLAASGHKGCLGPTGTGFLYVRPGVQQQLTPLRQGGTGNQSDSPSQPAEMPTLLECGNLNVVSLAGLAAGVEHVRQQSVDAIRLHETQLCQQMISGIADMPHCRLHGPTDPDQRTGVVSLSVEGYDPHEAAAILEMSAGVECRAGLHCAPRMHQRLGTSPGGALRLSPGAYTTPQQIDDLLDALCQFSPSP